jgi:NADH-quinone oxidoreductase subunit C
MSRASGTVDGVDALEGEQAEDAALALGFSDAADIEAKVSRDGACTPVIDVPASAWVEAALHARDVLGMDFIDWLSAVDQPDGDPAGLDVVLHVVATSSAGAKVDGELDGDGDWDVHGDGDIDADADADADADRDHDADSYVERDREADGDGYHDRFRRGGIAPRRVRRVMLRTRVSDAALVLPSLTAVWPGVAWHERETFEMFGLDFSGYDDGSGLEIRPLLLPDGFEGTPLRKSFVLAARAAKAWPGAKDPGDSGAGSKAPSRRKIQPPGVPDPSWGPHDETPSDAVSGSAASRSETSGSASSGAGTSAP